MKINPNYVVRNLLGETIIIPTGEVAQYFNGMISTNEVAGFIWENLEVCKNQEELLEKILGEFDVDEETAEKDMKEFLKALQNSKMIEL